MKKKNSHSFVSIEFLSSFKSLECFWILTCEFVLLYRFVIICCIKQRDWFESHFGIRPEFFFQISVWKSLINQIIWLLPLCCQWKNVNFSYSFLLFDQSKWPITSVNVIMMNPANSNSFSKGASRIERFNVDDGREVAREDKHNSTNTEGLSDQSVSEERRIEQNQEAQRRRRLRETPEQTQARLEQERLRQRIRRENERLRQGARWISWDYAIMEKAEGGRQVSLHLRRFWGSHRRGHILSKRSNHH